MENYESHSSYQYQSKFDKEMHGHHTFNIRDVKQVHVQMESKNAITHSFMPMIMPIVNISGRLMKLLYVKSQEAYSKTKSYHFPDNTIIPPNIVSFPGSSAIMKNYDLKIFLRQLLFEQLRKENIKKCFHLCNSQNSNRNDDTFNKIAAEFFEIKVKRMLIPSGTTQLLDVFFFRTYKVFVRFVIDSLEIAEIKIWQRNYFKLQAFSHFQFQASRFQDVIKYALYKSGYTSVRPGKFITPVNFCFYFNSLDTCSFESCVSVFDFKCTHCCKYFCFRHCIVDELHINCN